MCCKKSLKTIAPFIFTFLIGILLVSSFQLKLKAKFEVNSKSSNHYYKPTDEGFGCGECSLSNSKTVEIKCLACKDGILSPTNSIAVNSPKKETANLSVEIQKVEILFKPQPFYNDLAKENNTQGVVTLKVTFLANGEIGGVSVIEGLPDGLTEASIAAAKQIKFKPALKNGILQTVTKQIQYNFTIY